MITGKLISRAEALRRIVQLEEDAIDAGDTGGGEWLVKAYNAILACDVLARLSPKDEEEPEETSK